LTVPLDHDDLSLGSIDLKVARRLARRPAERIGVLLFNPGGPGVPATPTIIEGVRFFFSSTLLDRFDVVSWDPRGVGAGTQVDCVDDLNRYLAPDPTPETGEEADQIMETLSEFAAGCTERSGELLPHLSTTSTARDMDLLRAALGEEKISYLGNSYGAALGAVYATLFPERVRAMALDGAYDLSAPSAERWVQKLEAQERALNAALQSCATKPSCVFHSEGDPFTALDRLLASLDSDPLIAGETEVGLGHALWAVYWGLMSEQQWPVLMRALARARDGDGLELFGLAVPGPVLIESYYAISCLDEPTAGSPPPQSVIDELLAVAPRLGPFEAQETDPCDVWPADLDPPPPLTGAGAPPILVIGTTGDIATPLESGRDLAEHLEHGVLLVVERNHHTAYDPFLTDARCVNETIDHYLVDLETPPNLSVCQHGEPQLQPPD
jgi:pimeloyl-ACP methyl ester carboxylesterase